MTLVNFAKDLGFTCSVHTEKSSVIQLDKLQSVKYLVHRRMEFSSDRKRMSVLIEDPLDGRIKLYVKGADNVVQSRMARVQCETTMM